MDRAPESSPIGAGGERGWWRACHGTWRRFRQEGSDAHTVRRAGQSRGRGTARTCREVRSGPGRLPCVVSSPRKKGGRAKCEQLSRVWGRAPQDCQAAPSRDWNLDDCQSTDREGRLIHLQLQPLGGGQRRWREALPEDWDRTLVRGPAGLCLLGTGLVLKLKTLPSGNSPRVAGHPAGQSGARTGIQGP